MKTFLLGCLSLLCMYCATAQFSSLPSNLSNIRSSDISDEQLTLIATQMVQRGIDDNTVYQLLIQRGMVVTEASTLIERLQRKLLTVPSTSNNNNSVLNNSTSYNTFSNERLPKDLLILDSLVTVPNPKKIFGLEIFNNGVLDFNPNLKIATPMNYIIGPDDEISINIYGYQEAKYNLVVSPDGDITIPLVGSIYVSGLTMEQATSKIKSRLASAGYANIRTGLTKVNVSLGRIRSIKVTILGEVKKPGSYTLPSLATAFNALYLSGGPNDIGSMRNIQITRRGKVIDTLDMYDFLINGNQTGDIMLRDQDVIRIPPYQVRVSLEGEVKRSGLYEVKQGESLEKVLNYAGGFTDSAFTASIKGYKLTDTEKKIFDIPTSQFNNYYPSRTESFVVGKVIDRFTNRVSISGSVYLPGEYELSQGMKVSELLKKAQGLKEDAYRDRAYIRRLREDLSEEMISFSPANVLNGTETDVLLKREDSVAIASIFDLKENFTVRVNGEVRNPGEFPYRENMSVKDIILLAGGFTDAAAVQNIEIGRRLKQDKYDMSDLKIAAVISIDSLNSLATRGVDIKLNPWDVVVVRKNPGYRPQVNVKVLGEVVFPGDYVLGNKSERVSDIIKRAGGLSPEAYTNGAYLTRVNEKAKQTEENAEISKLQTQLIDKIQTQIKDTTNKVSQEVLRPYDQIAINLHKIMQNPGSKDDIILQEGDVLTIPQQKAEVRISGEVLFPTQIVYEAGMDFKDYISRAGGFTDNARKKRMYVLYPNGNVSRVNNFLFFKSYPTLSPGAEIIVPRASDRKRTPLTTGELIGVTAAITSMGGVLIALINSLNK